MKKRKQSNSKVISNRRARFDYELADSLVVGIELTGAETRSLRLGHGQLRGAFVTVKQGELFLINAAIQGTNGINIPVDEQTRPRRLLAKRREIDQLIAARQQGRTLVPLEILTRGRFIKLRLSVGKGKKRYDKRQSLRARDEARIINRALKKSTNPCKTLAEKLKSKQLLEGVLIWLSPFADLKNPKPRVPAIWPASRLRPR